MSPPPLALPPLARLDAIPDPGSIRVGAVVAGRPVSLMLVRRGHTVAAYVNRCPHTGAPLDFRPGQFLDADNTHILCANHAALFRIDDGACVHGPCAGRSLEPVPVRIVDGLVVAIK